MPRERFPISVMPMRVCINLATIHPKMTGITTFGRWIAGIPQWVSTPHEFELLLHPNQDYESIKVVQGQHFDPFIPRSGGIGYAYKAKERIRRSKYVPEGIRYLWRCLRPLTGDLFLSPHAKRKAWMDKRGFDVVHVPIGYPDPPPPHLAKAAYCINPHDFGWIHNPQFFSEAERQRLQERACISVEVASVIFVVAEHIKADAVNFFGAKPERIHVVWPGPPFQGIPAVSEDKRKEVRSKYQLPARFLYYPAITYEHKNHLRLMQAMRLMKGSACQDLCCVFSGAEGPFHAEFLRKVSELGVEGKVRWLGYIPYSDVHVLYTLADAVVMPSLYEASSGPIYEAMNLGCPVACSGIANLPWLVDHGKAGLLFDPQDVEAIADVLRRLWEDDALRTRLAAAGQKRVEDFSWQSFAAGYIKGYEQAAADRAR